MELKNLSKHVRSLAVLPENEAAVVSCYVGLEEGRLRDRGMYEQRVRSVRATLMGPARRDFEAAMEPIDTYLARELLEDAQGAAVFSRAGEGPFFLPLQFRIPLPTWIGVDSMPNIYHLVELKDNYHRYVVMISTERGARILEVNLGAVTEEVWKGRPELRTHVGRGWSKEHYQNHRRERTQKFIKEKIKILDKLMSAGGYAHLILAGHPTITERVRRELPKHLEEKLVDIVPASGKTPVADVVKATISAFIEAEEQESRSVAEKLHRQLHSGGLAVSGTGPTFQALKMGRVDTLVLARSYAPGRAWACSACDLLDPDRDKPAACPACGSDELQDLDVKEALVRMAEEQGCTVEVVNESESLMQCGGVGCLLRYRLAAEYA